MNCTILFEVRLNAVENCRTGNTRHIVRGELQTEMPHKLIILQFEGATGYYLIHLDENGEEITDTYHDTIENAMDQADFEFVVPREQWTRLI